MIDARILPLQRAALAPIARWLAHRGVRADSLSLAGFACGLLAVAALALGVWGIALLLIALNRLCDGLDGAVARLGTPTDRGAFLDISLDFVFYALVPLGFALHDPVQNALPAAILIAAFVGTGSSFLAFATIAAKQGRATPDYPTKGIYYLGGLTEGFETIVIFAAMCLWPAAFPALAVIFSLACAVTTLLRWHQGWRAFSAAAPHDPAPYDTAPHDTAPQDTAPQDPVRYDPRP
ncbi:CDP-alcohol phosphatidyltransferase family protein [Pseudooceanicola sediminis]|uniref:CDP-alcohol phosphatidyltransferase family protein n=1 Tax=Pseudooceanicola sediminis TaxID=2211117 RepID=A0A399J2M2_9RHOB|nr:CDP-alcohol phosphatidyltransferase family protein [Pseudooceanicola sediminis]KAA2315082.1 CDP-alcohol phosphatidyltransferase family protein [Puniceibacterium sp. HSS470]RII38897.1 CDP-alcohol phosphatidyltransferase family protein [Pseudooceanicola sediminis]|tara:strand:+ start:28137 stop:28844 length:708 start_codon:yes stop_codon:yes gene_type:complete